MPRGSKPEGQRKAKKSPAKGTPRKSAGGRPSKFTKELAETICERLALGESLRAICRDAKMPSQSMVFRWLSDNEQFREQYARARDFQADSWADEILQISDDGSNDTYTDSNGNERVDHDVVARSKLRVDTRKWLMARMAPRKYGDKLSVAGDGDSPLTVVIRKFTQGENNEAG